MAFVRQGNRMNPFPLVRSMCSFIFYQVSSTLPKNRLSLDDLKRAGENLHLLQIAPSYNLVLELKILPRRLIRNSRTETFVFSPIDSPYEDFLPNL